MRPGGIHRGVSDSAGREHEEKRPTGGDMLTQSQLDAMIRLRQEWEEASEDGLRNAKGSVGLMLADVTRALELTPDQQVDVLGATLYVDLNGDK
jgi:hypothetical protein